MAATEEAFSSRLPTQLVSAVKREATRTGRPQKLIIAAFLDSCLRQGDDQRDAIVREFIERSTRDGSR